MKFSKKKKVDPFAKTQKIKLPKESVLKEVDAANRIRINLIREYTKIEDLLKAKKTLTTKEQNILCKRLQKLFFIGEKRAERQIKIGKKEKSIFAFENGKEISKDMVNLIFLIRKLERNKIVSKDFGKNVGIYLQ